MEYNAGLFNELTEQDEMEIEGGGINWGKVIYTIVQFSKYTIFYV